MDARLHRMPLVIETTYTEAEPPPGEQKIRVGESQFNATFGQVIAARSPEDKLAGFDLEAKAVSMRDELGLIYSIGLILKDPHDRFPGLSITLSVADEELDRLAAEIARFRANTKGEEA